MTTHNKILLTGNTKLLIVLITFSIFIYLVSTNNWFQGLIVLNISLHYRDFIEYFTDFTDEIIYPEHLLKNKEKEKKIENYLDNKYGPSNIEISDSYNKYYDELYDNNINDIIQYSQFYNKNLDNIKKSNNENNENNVAEHFYNQLFNKHEKKIINKNFNKENFVNYKLGEVNSKQINDFDSFSKLKFQRDQKIYNRSQQPFANDDIKLMNHIDLNYNIPWWTLSMDIDGEFI